MIPVRVFRSFQRLQASGAMSAIADAPVIAVDCEGARLGRFGRVQLLTVSNGNETFCFDLAADPKLLDAVAPILSSQANVKIFHDCREDASAFENRHGVKLERVWDSQVAHNAVLELEGGEAYQSSLESLARIYAFPDFSQPPLPASFDLSKFPGSVNYAAAGVLPLPALYEEISALLGDPEGEAVVARSAKYFKNYPKLNILEVPDAGSLRPGLKLSGVLADVQESGRAVFKLNLGEIAGVAESARWIDACAVGDVVSLEVAESGLSDCQR
jgi:ribonuclease D